MARCKATEFATSMLDPPPPYTSYQVDERVAGDSANPHPRLDGSIPPTQVRALTSAQTGKIVSCHYCSYCTGGAIAIIICLFVAITVFPYPLQASCTVRWEFGEPCTFVMQRLRSQILNWSGCNDCGHRGNRCLYSLKKTKAREANTIRATHLSPNLQLVDDIRIEFKNARNDSCVAMAKSASRSWFMIFDYGANYCNLRNIVEGADLHMNPGFGELTNDTICTQRTTAVCG